MTRQVLGISLRNFSVILLFVILLSSGCAFIPGDRSYKGPEERPVLLESYYDRGSSYSGYAVEAIEGAKEYNARRFTIQTAYGDSVVDLFESGEKRDDLVLVFPLLGGKNDVVDHFAKYFADQGFDAAVVHRDSSFKDPKNFDRLEDIFKEGLIRDRIVLDFFEREFGKKKFGSFGISRGAINAAILAGVDHRMQFNIFAMGGADLVEIYNHSDQRRLKKYKTEVMSEKGITETDFLELLKTRIKSDPKYMGKYIDARNTLLILAAFDRTVPIQYGLKLREQIGSPDTVFLMASHYTSVLFSSFVPMLMKDEDLSLFPMGYIEREAANFYQKKMRNEGSRFDLMPLRLLQLPFSILGKLAERLWD